MEGCLLLNMVYNYQAGNRLGGWQHREDDIADRSTRSRVNSHDRPS
jgi:hypothetical protein